MHATKPLGALAAILVALTALGSLVAVVATTFASEWVVPSVVVLAIGVLVVAGLSALGGRSREWVTTPYW